MSCDPCTCIEMFYRDKEAWQRAVLQLLCNVITNTAPLVPTAAAVFDPLVAKTAASILAAYSSATDLADDTRSVTFDNQTDGDVYISMDGGVSDHYYLRSGQSLHVNLYDIGKVTTAAVHMKRGSNVPTTGNVFVYSMR